jgi:hypothetical protein
VSRTLPVLQKKIVLYIMLNHLLDAYSGKVMAIVLGLGHIECHTDTIFQLYRHHHFLNFMTMPEAMIDKEVDNKLYDDLMWNWGFHEGIDDSIHGSAPPTSPQPGAQPPSQHSEEEATPD